MMCWFEPNSYFESKTFLSFWFLAEKRENSFFLVYVKGVSVAKVLCVYIETLIPTKAEWQKESFQLTTNGWYTYESILLNACVAQSHDLIKQKLTEFSPFDWLIYKKK